MASENKLDVYIIPENFIEGGRIFNGMFKTRNFIEAIVLSLIVGAPLWMIHYPSISVKITVLSIFVLPLFMIAVSGINDSSLIEFAQQFLKWRKSKRVMLYNGKARSRAVRPADVIDAQEMPKDKLVQAVNNWKDKRKPKTTQTSFVEGVDFVFYDDENADSSFVSTEKRIMNQFTDNDNKTAKKRKKKSKKDTTLFLLENNSESDNAKINQNNELPQDEKNVETEACEVIEILNDIQENDQSVKNTTDSMQLSQDEFQIREGESLNEQ